MKVGDVVHLISEPEIAMTVSEITYWGKEEGFALCDWFDESVNLHREKFPFACLSSIKDDE